MQKPCQEAVFELASLNTREVVYPRRVFVIRIFEFIIQSPRFRYDERDLETGHFGVTAPDLDSTVGGPCCRVAPSDYSEGAPTDADAPVSGIRFLGVTVLLYVAIRHRRVNTLVADSGVHLVFPSGSSVTRRPPWLLAGSLGSVSRLSGATMRTLRLPLSVSTSSLRSAIDTSSCLARSLSPAAKSPSGVPGCCSCQCPPLFWPLPKRRQEALSSFQGTLSHICPALRPRPDHRVRLLTLWCRSRWHKDESSSNL
jgi:hypothetical protein